MLLPLRQRLCGSELERGQELAGVCCSIGSVCCEVFTQKRPFLRAGPSGWQLSALSEVLGVLIALRAPGLRTGFIVSGLTVLSCRVRRTPALEVSFEASGGRPGFPTLGMFLGHRGELWSVSCVGAGREQDPGKSSLHVLVTKEIFQL